MTIRPVVAGLLLFAYGSLAAQTTNPPYLSQFPTVDRVKKAMVTGDPRETALRQMGAFWQLQEIIKQLSGSREFRGLLPDEQRVMNEYAAAEYYIGKAIDSAYPGRYGNWGTVSANRPYAYMRQDPRFGIEGIATFRTLLPAAVQDLFAQSVGSEQARRLARARADTEEMMRARASAGGGGPTKLEQEQAGIRRCVESGRSEAQCIMEGLGKSYTDWVGGALPGVAGMMKPKVTLGLRMSGAYPGPGKFSLSFYPEQVAVGCADLVGELQPYSVAVQNGSVVITVQSAPAPFALTVRADDRLVGPSSVDITGQVQVGTEYGTRTWSDGRTEPISRPVYKTFTRRCNVGVLTASGPSTPLPSMAAMTSQVAGMVFGNIDKNAPAPPIPPGLRLAGEYGSQAAMDLEFRPEAVIVGCREATILRPYAIRSQGSQLLVSIQHGNTPFSLTLGADGRLTGSGTIRVDGRMVTGTSGNGELTYAPRSTDCGLGALAPASGGAAGATGSPSSPPGGGLTSAPTATGMLGPAAARMTPPAPGDGAVIQLESAAPAASGSPNPVAGRAFVLLEIPLEDVLKEAGASLPAGTPAVKAVTGNCSGVSGCQKIAQTLASHAVAFLKPDQSGIAQSPALPAGRYFLVGSATIAGQLWQWNVSIAAKAGWTKVVLSQGNAVR